MTVLMIIVSVVLAGLLVVAAARKLTHAEAVVRSYTRLGVPENRLNWLAGLLLAGAAGLLAGLWWTPLGIAAATAVVGYFVGAIATHLLARDIGGLPFPLTYLALAVAALVTRVLA